jgi:hypothetical protein
MGLERRKPLRSVESLLALLGGITCFLVVVIVLCLFVARQPTTLLMTALESAIAPLAFAVIQYTMK